MDLLLLQSLRQYDTLKKPALKKLCVDRGINKAANSVTELRAQLRDHDDNEYLTSDKATTPFENSAYIHETTTLGTNAKSAIEKWSLQPPFDSSINQADWETYSTTREKVQKKSDTVETEDGYLSDTELKDAPIILKDCRNRLSKLVSEYIPSADKKAISDSLCFKTFYVLDDGMSAPRSIDVSTRWYSSIGNGHFVDFCYEYHHYARWESTERFSTLDMRFGVASSSDTETKMGRWADSKDKKDICPIFEMRWSDSKNKEKRSPVGVRVLRALEEHMFGTKGVIPLLTLHEMLLSAATVLAHEEDNRWVRRVAERKFTVNDVVVAEKQKEEEKEEQDDEYDFDNMSNFTDEDCHEEALKTQRRNRNNAERDFFNIIMPIKAPEVTDEGLRHQARVWLNQALPKVMSDSEDTNSEIDRNENDDDDDNSSGEWETEDEDE